MKNLLIIGAGGCGREVLQWVKDINAREPEWRIKGFLDENLHALDGRRCDCGILCTPSKYEVQPDDIFVCAIGNGRTRKRIIEDIESRNGRFTSLIHPTAAVADTAVLGKNIILYPYSFISDNAVVGDGCIINMYSSIAHDVIMGEYCTVSAHCNITGMCLVGDRVFMGSGARMVPGVSVGNDVFICAGSTVMSRVRDGAKVIGTPAKKAGF